MEAAGRSKAEPCSSELPSEQPWVELASLSSYVVFQRLGLMSEQGLSEVSPLPCLPPSQLVLRSLIATKAAEVQQHGCDLDRPDRF